MKPTKYRAKKTAVDGRMFDSKAEAEYAMKLKTELSLGNICDLVYQPRFTLQEAFRDNCNRLNRKVEYVADFSFIEVANFVHVVVDVKGFLTADYKLKSKWFRKLNPEIVHREIKNGKDLLTHKPKKRKGK